LKLDTAVPDKIINLAGLRCPHTVIATIHALKTLSTGQIVQVTASDLNAPSNIAAWCHQSGHTLLDMYSEKEAFVFYIQKQGDEG